MTVRSTLGERHSEDRRPDTGARDWAATRTFSNAEIFGKTLVIWNVLAIPRRLITSGARPVTSSPRNHTWPAVGACRPETTLNSVDFPAPLGPITEKTCPSWTVKLTLVK